MRSVFQFIHVSKGNFSQQDQAYWVSLGRVAVVGTLGDHVGEIDSLTKHVARHRRFRWGYPEALGQDAREVGGPGPVPQQPPVMQLLKRLVTLALPFALYLEDLVGVIT